MQHTVHYARRGSLRATANTTFGLCAKRGHTSHVQAEVTCPICRRMIARAPAVFDRAEHEDTAPKPNVANG